MSTVAVLLLAGNVTLSQVIAQQQHAARVVRRSR